LDFTLKLKGVRVPEENKSGLDYGSQTFALPDGRLLGYCVLGEGKPVFYFHGTASSRLEALLLNTPFVNGQLRIIGVDRPGYGLSSFAPRKTLRDFVDDVNLLADHLGFEEFALLGWSGGGPFLLTYLALFPERVTQALVAGSACLPFNAANAHNNNPLAQYVMKFPFIAHWALKRFRAFVLKANEDIDAFLATKAGEDFLSEWPREDRKFFADPCWLAMMIGAMAEGFRQGNLAIETIFQEHKLFMKDWDAPLSLIPAEKLCIWQGTEDKTAQTENANRIAKMVREARLEIFSGKGHCVIFDNLEKLSKILLS
jgi:pimeloyl-ACP methyl ester carboxylesterase